MLGLKMLPKAASLLLAVASCYAGAQSVAPRAYVASPATAPLPSVAAEPIAKTSLATVPYVFRLKHRKAGAMSVDDKAEVRAQWPALAERARLFRFNLDDPGWTYRQTLCPAFRSLILLSFQHGPNPNGSSRFVAVITRAQPGVEIVPVYAHGSRPFSNSWKKPGTYGIFNRMLTKTRGHASMGDAANWLVIGMCYAELNGFPVQVMTARPLPGSRLDMLRLKAVQPQMRIFPNGGAEITFSDIAEPLLTANWTLRFNPHGQIISADRTVERQPQRIALKP